VGEEASSAGYGREVGKRLYLCYGRKVAVYMQNEEKQIKMWVFCLQAGFDNAESWVQSESRKAGHGWV
jgi:hypothetical protein